MPAPRRLRVAGGTARGLPLAEPRGVRLRPTSGLVREAIFNILRERIEGATVADLFAGTGALGIEALSHGAARAVFVEGEAACCQAILQSLARASFGDRASVLRGRLPGALSGIKERFDIVFIDPPYADENGPATLDRVATIVAPGSTVVYEHASRYNPPERPPGLILVERRLYGDSALALYAPQEGE